MKFTSNAQWPRMDADLNNSNVTSDEHDTLDQAQAVCDILDREGWGGDGKMFPVRTWVAKVDSGVDSEKNRATKETAQVVGKVVPEAGIEPATKGL